MMNQKDIANYFRGKYGTAIDQPMISHILNPDEEKRRPVPTSFALDLAEEFPGKTARQWKNATPKELKRAFDLLPEQALANPSNEEAA